MGKAKTTEQFIQEAKNIHGNKYDYSRVSYVNATQKVTIVCPEHGDFEQTPHEHLKGSGCKSCGYNRLSNIYTHTTERFIEKAKNIHGDKYDYSKVEYSNDNKKVTIICFVHGEFVQKANNHLMGQGCPQCNKGLYYTRDDFIEKAKEVHGNRYNYSKVEYVNISKKVTIKCYKHDVFEQSPRPHLNGQGCPKCAAETRGFWNPEYIRKHHPDKLNNPCTLYVLECYTENERFIKVGITTKTIEERYNKDKRDFLYQYDTLYEYHSTLIECSEIEQGLLEKFKDYQYIPIYNFAGSSECIDIGQKDTILNNKYK